MFKVDNIIPLWRFVIPDRLGLNSITLLDYTSPTRNLKQFNYILKMLLYPVPIPLKSLILRYQSNNKTRTEFLHAQFNQQLKYLRISNDHQRVSKTDKKKL